MCSGVGEESEHRRYNTYTLIRGWPGINYIRIWRHGDYGQKVIRRILTVGFENKFRISFVHGMLSRNQKFNIGKLESCIRGCEQFKYLGGKHR